VQQPQIVPDDQPIPPGWAVDAAGEPTTDPSAAAAISRFGGAKGFGLDLALEVLVATLMTTALGRDVHGTLDADEVCNKGDLFISIDPSVLPADSQQERVSAYLERCGRHPPGKVPRRCGSRVIAPAPNAANGGWLAWRFRIPYGARCSPWPSGPGLLRPAGSSLAVRMPDPVHRQPVHRQPVHRQPDPGCKSTLRTECEAEWMPWRW
jgi:hypothetical protein